MTVVCSGPHCSAPAWARHVLLVAGLYNIAFGFWAVFWPNAWFTLSGMDPPTYPMLWQCIGMVVGLYGLGYLAAASNPIVHWPVILVGFLGKVLGPVGFTVGIAQGTLPLSAGWIILLNDLIWWIPFAMILWMALQAHLGRPPGEGSPLPPREAAERFKLSTGETLAEASAEGPVALVFLRHFGCTFTRQLLRHLEDLKADAEREGARLVLVHMLERGQSRKYIHRGEDVARIADPHCDLYRAFGLGKGGFLELFGPIVWLRGAVAFFSGCGAGPIAGDGLQMPGAFLFEKGEILVARPARNASELPDVHGLFQTAH